MDGQRFGNIPASRFGSLSNELEEISKKKLGSHYDIKDQLQDISEKIEKAIETNVMLQQKITKLSEAISSLAMDLKSKKEEISRPSMPSGVPPPPKLSFDEVEEKPRTLDTDRFVNQLKSLTEQNIELLGTLKNIDEKLEKGSSKERIQGALKRAGAL